MVMCVCLIAAILWMHVDQPLATLSGGSKIRFEPNADLDQKAESVIKNT